jgi:hypothetical protein
MTAATIPLFSTWQPHATLLVLPDPATGVPVKRYETRNRPVPRHLLGRRVAIHAARNPADLRWLRDGPDDLTAPFREALARLGFPDPLSPPASLPSVGGTLPLGAILGTGILAACHRTDHLVDPGPYGDFSPGRFAWEMSDVRPLSRPLSYRAHQGWNYIAVTPEFRELEAVP